MTPGQFMDGVQTVALLITSGTLIVAVVMVGRVLKEVIGGLRDPLLKVVRDSEQTHRQLAAMWKRIEAIEDRTVAEPEKADPD
jgi:hypothetical protein